MTDDEQPNTDGRPQYLRADWLFLGPYQAPVPQGAVLVQGGLIRELGPVGTVSCPDGARVTDLGHAAIMPGLVNAHQHGRGISQLVMGYPDMALEPWIAGRRRHAPPDIYAVTRLAAEAMLANGVTATLHANYSYGSGDYPAELRAQISAYRAAGLRTTVCVGLQDRGSLIYPDGDEAAFRNALPKAATGLVDQPGAPPFMPDWPASRDLMDQLQAECRSEDLITLAWGPAGPQWVSDALWAEVARDAVARAIGVHFHLLESPAQANAARALYPEGTLERLRGLGVFNAPTSCAHGVYMTGQDIALAAAHGVVVVLNPGSNMRLQNGPPPAAALHAAGVPLATGTDNCALSDDEDYLRELRLSALLCQADTARAFAMATTGGARAVFLPEGHGTLFAKGPADLAAFRLDRIAPNPVLSAKSIADLLFARGTGADCILTMVAGSVRYGARDTDHARIAKLKDVALASVMARTEIVASEAVEGLQAALRGHYSARAGATLTRAP